jgi:hypothetical protein
MDNSITVRSLDYSEKIGKSLEYSLPMLGPEAKHQVEQLLSPQTLIIVAGVLTAWIISHFFGVGEIIDIILMATGVVAIGLVVFDGIGHLYDFAFLAYKAKSDLDLKESADHFAKAVSILGIQAVLAVLFRGAPKTYKGGRINVGQPPPFVKGVRSRPPLTSTRLLPAGYGETGIWGEIIISRLGKAADRRLVALHENVHRLFTPKLKLLRNFRVANRASSYSRSPLSMYLEEALAEIVAQVGVNGFKSVFTGIAFPVKNGYVTLIKESSLHGRKISPFVPEFLGLVAGAFIFSGVKFKVYFSSQPPKLKTPVN